LSVVEILKVTFQGVNEVANISAGEEHIFTDFRGPLTTLHARDYNVIYILRIHCTRILTRGKGKYCTRMG
jgi:hypothetical protein